MKIIIFAATEFELAPLLKAKVKSIQHQSLKAYRTKIAQHQIDIVITGIGLVASAFAAAKFDLKKYDLIVNAGVAGSFDRSIKLGECIIVKEEKLIDLGAEDGKNWLSIAAIGLKEIDTIDLNLKKIPKYIQLLLTKTKKVKAISSNTAHGNAGSIASILKRYPAQVESMEGAGIAYATHQNKVPLLQIRSISNYVEKRDKSKWQMALAIETLNTFLLQFFNHL
jgi:futalosine hydrolase